MIFFLYLKKYIFRCYIFWRHHIYLFIYFYFAAPFFLETPIPPPPLKITCPVKTRCCKKSLLHSLHFCRKSLFFNCRFFARPIFGGNQFFFYNFFFNFAGSLAPFFSAENPSSIQLIWCGLMKKIADREK